MGYIIGVDFGTTNSIVSIFENGSLSTFAPIIPDNSAYIPSAVVYDNHDGRVYIGKMALSTYSDGASVDKIDLYRYFKMYLNIDKTDHYKNQLDNLGWKNGKDPYEVTKDYLAQLLIGKEKHSFAKTKGEIDKIVVTVPAVWDNNEHNTGRSNLKKILKDELNLHLVRLISEPQAAAAYYIWWLKNEKKDDFSGNLLICDMGGGTFDISLVSVNKDSIKVLYTDGSGMDGLGHAGVNYDTKVARQLYMNIHNKEPDITSPNFEKFIQIIERRKLALEPEDEKKLSSSSPYYNDMLAEVKYTFDVTDNKYIITPRIWVETFDQFVYPQIDGVLSKTKKYLEDNNLEYSKVLIVGGFGQFVLVKEAIYKILQIQNTSKNTAHFDGFEKNFFAISFGAALVAAGEISIDEKIKYDIGVKVKQQVESHTKDKNFKYEEVILIKKDKTLNESGQIEYLAGFVEVEEAEQIVLRIFIDKETHKVERIKNVKFDKFSPGKTYRLGMRIDESKVVYLVLSSGAK